MAFIASSFCIGNHVTPILVMGAYLDQGKQAYKNSYYDRLRDSDTGQLCTIRVPDGVKKQLAHGQQYIFTGTPVISHTHNDGKLDPVFVVASAVPVDRPVLNDVRPAAIIRKKTETGFNPRAPRGARPRSSQA